MIDKDLQSLWCDSPGGLQYCPGCLRAIEGRRDKEIQASTPEPAPTKKIGVDSLFVDLEASWDNMIYSMKSNICFLLGRPEPPRPPTVPATYGRDSARFAFGNSNLPATMALSEAYTRVVCPKCQNVQRTSPELSPFDVVTCRSCRHQFPGAFAAEFRKGADMECFHCGVTTFCVSGLKDPTCPNCKFKAQKVRAKTRLKPGVLLGFAVSILLFFFVHSIVTRTTTQFVVGFCVACIGSLIGFVTLVALGV